MTLTNIDPTCRQTDFYCLLTLAIVVGVIACHIRLTIGCYSVVVLNVILLNVPMLNVVAPETDRPTFLREAV